MSMNAFFRRVIKKNIGLFRGKFNYFNTTVYFPENSLIFRMACDQGVYDREVYDFIFTYLKEDGLFIDIGSNIGLLSVSVLKKFDRTEVVAFEPSATVLPFLLRTHREHKKNKRWVIHQIALGDAPGEIMFENNKDLDSAFDNISVGESYVAGRRNSKKKIQITTIDNILEIPVAKFTSMVMKIDVEGFEYKILSGAVSFIQKHKPHIIIEIVKDFINKYGTSLKEFIDFADKMNYTIYGLSTLNKISNSTELEFSLKRNLNFMLIPN